MPRSDLMAVLCVPIPPRAVASIFCDDNGARADRHKRDQPSVDESPLLQVDGLIVPGLVELRAPYLVHALMVGAAESHRRPLHPIVFVDPDSSTPS
jgi:hypothetical protein